MLKIVRLALTRPYTFIVLALLILVIGPLSALRTPTDIFPDIRIPVISVVWNYAGLLRENLFLLEGFAAQAEFADGLKKLVRAGKGSRRLQEAFALNRVAHAILHAALARTESRGAHFRNDFPKRDDTNFQRHSVYRPGDGPASGTPWSPTGKVAFEAW